MAPSHRHSLGIARREFLQVGFSGLLGLGLPGLLAARARAGAGSGRAPRARSLIMVFMSGGLSHLDSFDMKPEAPEGIRGEFQPIDTSVSGLRICEHLPGLAQRAHQWAVVRSMSHPQTNHLNATHQILTGQPQPGRIASTRLPRAAIIRVMPLPWTRSGHVTTGCRVASCSRRS